jgi:hypothetical protein
MCQINPAYPDLYRASPVNRTSKYPLLFTCVHPGVHFRTYDQKYLRFTKLNYWISAVYTKGVFIVACGILTS